MMEVLNVHIQELQDKKFKGMFVRSRINRGYDGEKPSAYFCKLYIVFICC